MTIFDEISDIFENNRRLETAPAVHAFVARLLRAPWSTPAARSAGMLPLLHAYYAQAGTVKINERAFVARVAELTIKEILPPILKLIGREAEAVRCEKEGSSDAAKAAWLSQKNPPGSLDVTRAAIAASNAAGGWPGLLARAEEERAAAAAIAAFRAHWAAVWHATRDTEAAAGDAPLFISASIALRALAEQGWLVREDALGQWREGR